MDETKSAETRPAETQAKSSSKGLAIASMVCGIISVLTCWFIWIALPCAIVALILGIIALAKKHGGKGMSIAGIITGAIGIIISAIIIIIAALAVKTVVDNKDWGTWTNTLEKTLQDIEDDAINEEKEEEDLDSWEELIEWGNTVNACLEKNGLKDKEYSDMTAAEQSAFWGCYSE